MGHKKSTMKRVTRLVLVGLAAAAIVQELRKPAVARAWHGTIIGVPYDFRMPTIDRIKQRVWSPDTPEVLVPHVFGVGWTVNAGRVAELVKDALGKK